MDMDAVFAAYLRKDFLRVSEIFVDIIKHFNEYNYTQFNREQKNQFNDCVTTIFFILSQPDFQIPAEYARVFVNVNHILTNMAKASVLGSTQPFLDRAYHQENNYVKILTFATCHNPLTIDLEALFQPNVDLASLWWANYQTAAIGTLSQEVHDRVVKHLQSIPKGFVLQDFRTAPLYFQCTYFSPETDHIIKQEYNRQLRARLSGAKIHTTPNPKSIAIVCDRWQPTTAVYKSCYHQIERLADKYDLTLVSFSEDKQSDTRLFKHVKRVALQPSMTKIDFSSIKYNDFQLAYFPDIGMNYESVCLSNMQVAPIMATGYGHPVSTFGSKVDYFIGGLDSEVPELAATNYSERLVLIPGIGAHPVFPNYQRKYPQPDKFYINCCWTSPKINYPMIEALREIKRRATRPIHFQFFPSWTITRYQACIPFLKEMETLFEGAITVYLDTPYQDYLEILEKARITLDSYPFGGYNTIVDSLFVGCPVVTLEGTRFFNRASSALMRKVGLPQLVTTSRKDYINKALELIDKPEELQHLRDMLMGTNLRELLVDNDEPVYFAKALDYLIANHSELKQSKSREPLILA
jgi:hypothetical protein